MNDNDYVRKDVFDANVDTLLVLIDKTNERINDLKDDMSRNITILAGTIAGIGFIIAALQLIVIFVR